MTIRTILHGGLGNQLFQLFYSELLGNSLGIARLSLITARLGSYAVDRKMELAPLLSDTDLAVEVSDRIRMTERWRLPKLIRHVTGHETILRWGPRHALVDGYFQSPNAYAAFSGTVLTAHLGEWQRRLLDQKRIFFAHRSHLTHIRLTDFIAGGQHPHALAGSMLARIPDGGAVMTDDEVTIGAMIAASPSCRPTLIPTSGLSSWDVLKTMSAFRTIDTNGSSLACWAAALAGATLTSTNTDHVAFTRFSRTRSDVDASGS